MESTRATTSATRARASRPVRTLRGTVAASVSTLFAASSHTIAGGDITWLAIVATALLALPICVALAGRIASLWRLALAVTSAQFLYHWSFAGLGAPSAPTEAGSAPAPLHAEHLAALARFSPDLTGTTALDTAMWIGHALAAVLTVALLHRGERACLALMRLVLRALPVRVPRAVAVPEDRSTAIRPLVLRIPMRSQLAARSAISHRGPPAPSFSA